MNLDKPILCIISDSQIDRDDSDFSYIVYEDGTYHYTEWAMDDRYVNEDVAVEDRLAQWKFIDDVLYVNHHLHNNEWMKCSDNVDVNLAKIILMELDFKKNLIRKLENEQEASESL